MEKEGPKSIVEGGGDKLLQLLADVEEAAEEVAFQLLWTGAKCEVGMCIPRF